VSEFSGNSYPSPLQKFHGRTGLGRRSLPKPDGSSMRIAGTHLDFHLVAKLFITVFFCTPILEFEVWIFSIPCHLLASGADSGYIPSLIYAVVSIRERVGRTDF
jgi:hypothetical protein